MLQSSRSRVRQIHIALAISAMAVLCPLRPAYAAAAKAVKAASTTATRDSLREKNLRTIHAFLKDGTVGVVDPYTDDGIKELTFVTFMSPDGTPLRYVGKEEIRKNAKFNETGVSSCMWKNLKIYSTQDPDVFWAAGSGVGALNVDGKIRKYEQKDYFLNFEMRDGRIKRYREIMNPNGLLKTVGGKVELPPGFRRPQ